MTTNGSIKRAARDVQERTRWSYQFCRRVVETLGYDAVCRAIDDSPGNLQFAGETLNERMRAQTRLRLHDPKSGSR